MPAALPNPERKPSPIKDVQDHGWLILAGEAEGKLVGSADIFMIKSTIDEFVKSLLGRHPGEPRIRVRGRRRGPDVVPTKVGNHL